MGAGPAPSYSLWGSICAIMNKREQHAVTIMTHHQHRGESVVVFDSGHQLLVVQLPGSAARGAASKPYLLDTSTHGWSLTRSFSSP